MYTDLMEIAGLSDDDPLKWRDATYKVFVSMLFHRYQQAMLR